MLDLSREGYGNRDLDAKECIAMDQGALWQAK